MEMINIWFKRVICSLILIYYSTPYIGHVFMNSIFTIFKIEVIPRSIDYFILYVLNIISFLGFIFLSYSLICFFMESFKFIRKNRN